MLDEKTYKAEILWAATGEEYGRALFSHAALLVRDEGIACKLRMMACLEDETLSRMKLLLDKYGLDYDASTHVQRGKERAKIFVQRKWLDVMKAFAESVDEDIARMQALHDMAPDDDQEVLAFLVEHEVVLKNVILSEIENAGMRPIHHSLADLVGPQ